MAYQLIIDALADPTRREIFERLRKKRMSVGEIAAGLPVSRPAVSQHLRVLLEVGLVSMSAQGRRHVYRVEAQGLVPLRDYLDGFWEDALLAFAESFEDD